MAATKTNTTKTNNTADTHTIEQLRETANADTLGVKIVVVDNGFVYVGNVHREAGFFIITNCFNVRRFGTTGGIGQLAMEGPTSETALDRTAPVLIPDNKLCHLMAVSETRWASTIG